MSVIARLIFGLVGFASRHGLAEAAGPLETKSARLQARRTGIRGETYAYWYLRRHGYVIVARNYTAPGIKGEIDLIGYDGPIVAFIEVKTRAGGAATSPKPEEAVTSDKRRRLVRMARQFLAERRIGSASCRFDVLAIESRSGRPPQVRLHKDAFASERGG